jgi:flagellin-like protein
MKRTLKNRGTDEDRAVSPVIGVILMVAITVILAAVIGTFVLNLGDDVQANPQAGVSFSEEAGNDDEVRITINSKQKADTIKYEVTAPSDSGPVGSSSVGDAVTVTVNPGERIIITATTAEGNKAVIREYEA